MPFPKTGNERARPDLAATLFDFDMQGNRDRMVALQVFPMRDVEYYKGTYGRVSRKQMLGRAAGVPGAAPGWAFQRAPRTGYQKDDMSFSDASWETTEFGLSGRVDEKESRAYRDYFDHEVVVTSRVAGLLAIERELRVSNQVFSTTIFAGALQTDVGSTASRKWSNPATADPIDQVRTARLAVYGRTGRFPNCCVINAIAFEYLIACDQIRSRIHAQGAGSPDRASLINKQIVAQALNIDEVIVAEGVYDPSNPNDPLAATAIWGPHCSVFTKSRSMDVSEPTLGRTFHWPIDDSMPQGFVEQYYDNETRGTYIRVRQEEDNRLIDADAGHLLLDVY